MCAFFIGFLCYCLRVKGLNPLSAGEGQTHIKQANNRPNILILWDSNRSSMPLAPTILLGAFWVQTGSKMPFFYLFCLPDDFRGVT